MSRMPAPAGLAYRPYTENDAAAVTDLMNRAEAAHGGDPGLSVDNCHAILTAVAKDLEHDSRLVFAPGADGTGSTDGPGATSGGTSSTDITRTGTLVAVGAVGPPSAGGRRAGTWGAVHPDWQGRGIGRDLLGWQLARLSQLKAAQDPAGTWDVHAGADQRDPGAIRLFESFGMKPVRYFLEMVADPAAAPDVPVPDGLRIATYTPDLAEPVWRAHSEAFADHWAFEPEPFEKFRNDELDAPDLRPDLSMIAVDGEAVAGYVICYDGADGRQWVGMVGTRRGWRRRGVAGALVAASLRAGAATDRTLAILGVDSDSPTGAVSVYERVGFTMRSRSVSYELHLPA